jgi:hypothetical protein
MPIKKSYILHKKELNTKTNERLRQKYQNDPEYRERAKQRAKEQYKRRQSVEVFNIKREIDKYEDELNTVHNEYLLYKESYDKKSNDILCEIEKLQLRLREMRRKDNNDTSDTSSISSNDTIIDANETNEGN